MQTQLNNCSESGQQGRRARVPLTVLEEPQSYPKKRQNKNQTDQQNPYQAIPWLPHVKLTQEEMNSDPIQIFIELQQKFAEYGAVKVSTCDKWNYIFKERIMDRGITTRIQHLSKLKHGKAFQQNVQAYSINGYETYATNFEKNYKYRTNPKGKTLESKKQFEYWSLVTKPQYEKLSIKVQYAADLPTTKYGSGFPMQENSYIADQNFVYSTNLFNLNNIMNSPCSVLSMATQRKQKVSGITHPWLYRASMFSSFCWHVQDLCVNSLNYNHKGGIKTWYVIPGAYKNKFDNFIKENYSKNNHTLSLLDRITFMVDPLQIIKAGIPVYKTYQKPHDFICTFFSAYHCGFSQSYNIGEAVNFLSPLSLQIMQEEIKKKKLKIKNNPCVIPIEWIIYQNFNRLSRFKKYQEKIKEAYYEMITQERKQMQEINRLYKPGSQKYDKSYCAKCKQYLYLHAFLTKNDKAYCFDHLKKQLQQHSNLVVLVREPNKDREYILTLFGEVLIQQKKQLENKEKNTSSSKNKKH